jgi:hypothetical protein
LTDKTRSYPPVNAVDPDGDIILELTRPDGKSHLLVSSKVLALASPVFARMFKSQFKEGLSNNSSTSEAPRVIQLSDDDEEAFIFLCNLLHYRRSNVPLKLTVDCLSNLAIICDKWDLTPAVAPFAESWIQGVACPDRKARNKLFSVAYVLDAPHAFSMLSWEILAAQVGPFVDLPGLSDNELVPNSLISMSDIPEVNFSASKTDNL